jgi:hypothetical protein
MARFKLADRLKVGMITVTKKGYRFSKGRTPLEVARRLARIILLLYMS